jgi:hypothetical protein
LDLFFFFSKEEMWRRGTLQPKLSAVLLEDKRPTAPLQLLCRGDLAYSLARCVDFWDGGSISPLSDADRRAILSMHAKCGLEDLDVVAFTYTPVDRRLEDLLGRPALSAHHSPPQPVSALSSAKAPALQTTSQATLPLSAHPLSATGAAASAATLASTTASTAPSALAAAAVAAAAAAATAVPELYLIGSEQLSVALGVLTESSLVHPTSQVAAAIPAAAAASPEAALSGEGRGALFPTLGSPPPLGSPPTPLPWSLPSSSPPPPPLRSSKRDELATAIGTLLHEQVNATAGATFCDWTPKDWTEVRCALLKESNIAADGTQKNKARKKVE